MSPKAFGAVGCGGKVPTAEHWRLGKLRQESPGSQLRGASHSPVFAEQAASSEPCRCHPGASLLPQKKAAWGWDGTMSFPPPLHHTHSLPLGLNQTLNSLKVGGQHPAKAPGSTGDLAPIRPLQPEKEPQAEPLRVHFGGETEAQSEGQPDPRNTEQRGTGQGAYSGQLRPTCQWL